MQHGARTEFPTLHGVDGKPGQAGMWLLILPIESTPPIFSERLEPDVLPRLVPGRRARAPWSFRHGSSPMECCTHEFRARYYNYPDSLAWPDVFLLLTSAA